MSRYRGPRLRLQRRLGVRLYSLTRKNKRLKKKPGQPGKNKKGNKKSAYRLRLEEKQKLRFNYSLSEKQLFKYIKQAKNIKGSTGFITLKLVEMRLDNIVYRLNLAPTIIAARQLVSHGHIKVNNRVITIGSFQCKPGDLIEGRDRISTKTLLTDNVNKTKKKWSSIPPHLAFKKNQLKGYVKKLISRKDISIPLNELLIIEYYSNK